MTSLPADCDVTAAEGQPTVTVGLGSLCRLSGERRVLLLCSGQGRLVLRYPGYHRALTMASAWERKCHYSHLGKKAVFLPNLLLREEFTDISYPKMLEGVLLLADVSGGLGMAESPWT